MTGTDLAGHDEMRRVSSAKELESALVKALERATHRDPALDVDGNTEPENASEREDEEPSPDQNISSGVTVQNEQKVFFYSADGIMSMSGQPMAASCFVRAAEASGP